jgi:hypothetical protein
MTHTYGRSVQYGVIVTTAALLLYAVVHSVAPQRRVMTRRTVIDAEASDQLCISDTFSKFAGGALRAVLLVTSVHCPFSQTNGSVILQNRVRQTNVPFIQLYPNDHSEDAEVHALRAKGQYVIQANLHWVGTERTPTLLLVDDHWKVITRWIGGLTEGKEDLILNRLFAGEPLQSYKRISRSEFNAVRSPQVIVFSQPMTGFASPRYTPRFIPPEDLSVRVHYEFSSQAPIYVDCDTIPSAAACQSALLDASFATDAPLVAIDQPRHISQCGTTKMSSGD